MRVQRPTREVPYLSDPAAIKQAEQKRAIRQAHKQAKQDARFVRPINRLLEAAHSCGVILLEQSDTEVLDAQRAALKRGLEHTARERAKRFRKGAAPVPPILWIPAQGTVQGEAVSEAEGMRITESMLNLRRAHGSAGILGIDGLSYNPETTGGNDYVRARLCEMMLTQGIKSLPERNEPAVVAVGMGSPDDLATRFGRGYHDAGFSGQLATRIALMYSGEFATALPPVIPRISQKPRQPHTASFDPAQLVPDFLRSTHL